MRQKRNQIKFALVVLLAIMIAKPVSATIGTPVPTLKEGKVEIGLVYFSQSMDMTFTSKHPLTIETNGIQATIDYGILDWCTIFGQFGCGPQSISGVRTTDKDAFVWDLGIKAGMPFGKHGWGGGLTITTSGTHAKHEYLEQKIGFDSYSTTIATMIEYATNQLTVYAGPCWITGNTEASIKTGKSITDENIYHTTHSDTTDSFGVCCGLRFDAPFGINGIGEYTQTDDHNNWSLGAVYKF